MNLIGSKIPTLGKGQGIVKASLEPRKDEGQEARRQLATEHGRKVQSTATQCTQPGLLVTLPVPTCQALTSEYTQTSKGCRASMRRAAARSQPSLSCRYCRGHDCKNNPFDNTDHQEALTQREPVSGQTKHFLSIKPIEFFDPSQGIAWRARRNLLQKPSSPQPTWRSLASLRRQSA